MGSKKKTDNIESSPDELTALVRSYKLGNESSFERIERAYRPLLDSMVNRCYEQFSPYYERDDIRQFALIALSKAAQTYDVDQKNVTFGLYAKVCIGNALVSRLRWAKKHYVEVLPMESIFDMADASDVSGEIIDQENVKKLHELIKSTLSDFENEVFRLYAGGYSSSEIAEGLGKTEKSVDNAIFRARKKLKAVLNETPREAL